MVVQWLECVPQTRNVRSIRTRPSNMLGSSNSRTRRLSIYGKGCKSPIEYLTQGDIMGIGELYEFEKTGRIEPEPTYLVDLAQYKSVTSNEQVVAQLTQDWATDEVGPLINNSQYRPTKQDGN